MSFTESWAETFVGSLKAFAESSYVNFPVERDDRLRPDVRRELTPRVGEFTVGKLVDELYARASDGKRVFQSASADLDKRTLELLRTKHAYRASMDMPVNNIALAKVDPKLEPTFGFLAHIKRFVGIKEAKPEEEKQDTKTPVSELAIQYLQSEGIADGSKIDARQMHAALASRAAALKWTPITTMDEHMALRAAPFFASYAHLVERYLSHTTKFAAEAVYDVAETTYTARLLSYVVLFTPHAVPQKRLEFVLSTWKAADTSKKIKIAAIVRVECGKIIADVLKMVGAPHTTYVTDWADSISDLFVSESMDNALVTQILSPFVASHVSRTVLEYEHPHADPRYLLPHALRKLSADAVIPKLLETVVNIRTRAMRVMDLDDPAKRYANEPLDVVVHIMAISYLTKTAAGWSAIKNDPSGVFSTLLAMHGAESPEKAHAAMFAEIVVLGGPAYVYAVHTPDVMTRQTFVDFAATVKNTDTVVRHAVSLVLASRGYAGQSKDAEGSSVGWGGFIDPLGHHDIVTDTLMDACYRSYVDASQLSLDTQIASPFTLPASEYFFLLPGIEMVIEPLSRASTNIPGCLSTLGALPFDVICKLRHDKSLVVHRRFGMFKSKYTLVEKSKSRGFDEPVDGADYFYFYERQAYNQLYAAHMRPVLMDDAKITFDRGLIDMFVSLNCFEFATLTAPGQKDPVDISKITPQRLFLREVSRIKNGGSKADKFGILPVITGHWVVVNAILGNHIQLRGVDEVRPYPADEMAVHLPYTASFAESVKIFTKEKKQVCEDPTLAALFAIFGHAPWEFAAFHAIMGEPLPALGVHHERKPEAAAGKSHGKKSQLAPGFGGHTFTDSDIAKMLHPSSFWASRTDPYEVAVRNAMIFAMLMMSSKDADIVRGNAAKLAKEQNTKTPRIAHIDAPIVVFQHKDLLKTFDLAVTASSNAWASQKHNKEVAHSYSMLMAVFEWVIQYVHGSHTLVECLAATKYADAVLIGYAQTLKLDRPSEYGIQVDLKDLMGLLLRSVKFDLHVIRSF